MDFHIYRRGHFSVEHCSECLVPGYLIVSPTTAVQSLAELPRLAQEELGPFLAAVTEAVRNTIAPERIYCAQFGEEYRQFHFHIFPRTAEITAEFLRAFPEQQNLIHGPLLMDWARSRYRVPKGEVWKAVSPLVSTLQEAFTRADVRSSGCEDQGRAPV